MYRLYWVYMEYNIYLCTDCIGCTWSTIYIYVQIVLGVHGVEDIALLSEEEAQAISKR